MIYHNYSSSQLENKATQLLKQFDPERLLKAKPIDVYEVIEKCLGVPYDWKYITPDHSIWGMTFFRPGYHWVWPCPYYKEGMLPQKVYYEKGTIVIDSFLTEIENRGPENFTVMHEVFHQILHQECFTKSNCDYKHKSEKKNFSLQPKGGRSALEICETQANYCAACFLMPGEPIKKAFYKMKGLDEAQLLKSMAAEFCVSKQAIKIRLKSLKLIP